MKKFIDKNIKVLLFSCVFVMTIAVVVTSISSYAIENENNQIYTRDELSEMIIELQSDNNASNEFLKSYPVNSEYTSYSNTSPADLFGGTWIPTWSDYDRKEIGSQVIHEGLSGTAGNIPKTTAVFAYNTDIITSFFGERLINDYHYEYRVSAQVSNQPGSCNTQLFLNNIATSKINTWSGDDYRLGIITPYFKTSDITLLPTGGSYPDGIHLQYEITGDCSRWSFRNVTFHVYLTSNDIIYKWRRTA